jgi:hypothetical protein
MATASPISLAGAELGDHRHICAFFRTPDEEYQTLFPFVREGIEHGDRVVSIIPRDRTDFLDRLRGADVDVDEAQRARQLEVLSTDETYMPDGHFDAERMLGRLIDALLEGRTLGFPLTRLVAHPESALQAWEDATLFLEYEARLNYALLVHDDPVICTYDLNQVRAGMAFDVMRTHPTALIGGVLQENPFFVAPEVFLEEQRMRNEPHGSPAG